MESTLWSVGERIQSIALFTDSGVEGWSTTVRESGGSEMKFEWDRDMSGEQAKPPYFSNGTEWEIWSYNYCDKCWHDRRAWRDDVYEEGCPLIVQSMHREPIPMWINVQRGSWVDADGDEHPHWSIHCLQFTPDDGGPDEGLPVPWPTPPGQSAIFDASEFNWDQPTRRKETV
jgi:hypothetical protein